MGLFERGGAFVRFRLSPRALNICREQLGFSDRALRLRRQFASYEVWIAKPVYHIGREELPLAGASTLPLETELKGVSC
jgi:hypothetical protein